MEEKYVLGFFWCTLPFNSGLLVLPRKEVQTSSRIAKLWSNWIPHFRHRIWRQIYIKYALTLDSDQYVILLICNSNICLNTINKICWSIPCRGYYKCHRNYPWETSPLPGKRAMPESIDARTQFTGGRGILVKVCEYSGWYH